MAVAKHYVLEHLPLKNTKMHTEFVSLLGRLCGIAFLGQIVAKWRKVVRPTLVQKGKVLMFRTMCPICLCV